MAATPLVRQLPPELGVLPSARAAVRAWLEEWPVGPDVMHEELVLAGTELCTEAIEEGGPGPIVLRGWSDDHFVVLEVEGPQPAEPTLPTVRPLWDDEVRDLRLTILRSVCDELWRGPEGAARLVRCRRCLSWATPPAR